MLNSKDRQELINLLVNPDGQRELINTLVEIIHEADMERVDVDQLAIEIDELVGGGYSEILRDLITKAAGEAEIIAETEESPFWDKDDLNSL